MNGTLLARNPVLAAAGAALLMGLVAILGAWAFQLIGGYVPCKLCLQQRIPYYAGSPLLLIAVIAAARGAIPWGRIALSLAGLIFAVGLALAIYHAGAEWGWWPGPSDCGATGGQDVGSVEDLMSRLETIEIVSCTEASFRFLGLSFAGWNAAVSLMVVALAAWGASKKPAAA